jgi:hypothetical protein
VPNPANGKTARYPPAHPRRGAQRPLSRVRHHTIRRWPAAATAPHRHPVQRRADPPRRPAIRIRLRRGALHRRQHATRRPSDQPRAGWQRDINVVFPIDRLRELAAIGEIGGVAETHYTVMGSTDPAAMDQAVNQIEGQLRQERIDSVLLSPV